MSELVMRPLIPAAKLQERIQKLGADITSDYKGKKITLVGVLKGSFIFLADLARAIDLDCEIEFIGVSSYEGMHSTGQVRIETDLRKDMEGQDILLVEDIIDTGTTIDYLTQVFALRKPNSLKVCCLLSKPEAHKTKMTIDYTGFEISKEFVVGYGLDYNGLYRNLPDLMQVV
ncbi:MAG: hypoxanthine phosphoribosyltransferase [Chitinophagaceae bacterium]|nr:hypoxanthine phosphoribosyltransferase [Oligoflexus sp.]